MDIQLDAAMQSLDPNAQQVIVNAALAYARNKQTAAPTEVAPADGGRAGDEQYPAPVDTIKLLDTTTTAATTMYEIEISVAGTLDHVGVEIVDDGSTHVRPVE